MFYVNDQKEIVRCAHVGCHPDNGVAYVSYQLLGKLNPDSYVLSVAEFTGRYQDVMLGYLVPGAVFESEKATYRIVNPSPELTSVRKEPGDSVQSISTELILANWKRK